MDGFVTVTGGQLLCCSAVLLVVVLVAVAGRVLLAAAVIVGAQWAGDHLLGGEHDVGVGGARRPGAAGRLHPRGRADRQYRAGQWFASSGRWPAMSPELLIVIGSGLTVVGAGMFWSCRPRTRRRRALRPHPVWGSSGALICAGFVGGVITGVQWVVVSQTAPGAAWVVVLALPGFLAGATVVRLLVVIGVVLHRRRQRRSGASGVGADDAPISTRPPAVADGARPTDQRRR